MPWASTDCRGGSAALPQRPGAPSPPTPARPPPPPQGLVKAEGQERFGAAFAAWQSDPSGFEIDGHAPVRELWHRGSVAWQHVLTQGGAAAGEGRTPCALVVAHNAVNQVGFLPRARGRGRGSCWQLGGRRLRILLLPPPGCKVARGSA